MNDITYAVSVDVNSPTIPYNVYVASVLDSNVRYLEITLYQNGNIITLSNTATATASLVTDNVLIDDSVECTISNNIITVPLEDLQRHGNLDVQVTVTEDTKVLAIPFPIQVRVTPNIAENAQIDGNSSGSYAEVVHEISEARGSYTNLKERLDHTGATDEQVTKAVEDYLDEHGAENLVYEALDYALSNDPTILSPKLTVDNTVEPIYNPVGHYILYYIDSDDGRHNIFDFSQYFAEKAAVPSKTSQLTNDSGFLTQHQSLAAYRTASAQDTIDAAQDTAIAAKYTKPSGGISASDLASAVQTSLGKADTALQPSELSYVTPQQFGAKGDGVTDDTAAINTCFASGASNVFFPKGTYLVEAHHAGFTHETEGGLRPQSNCIITLSPDATIKCSTSPTDFYNILHFVNVDNVIVQGGRIVGDKATHVQISQPTYEFGHGVGIQNSTNIIVRDMEICDCIGDGVILNVSGNQSIMLDNLTIHDCRRQGVSLTSGDGIVISNCKIYDIAGTSPQSGIDIEPDGEKSVKNVVIDSCNIHDTVGASVIVANVNNIIDQIHVNGCLLDYMFFNGGSNVTMDGCKSEKVTVKCDNAAVISASNIEEIWVGGGSAVFSGCNFISSGKGSFINVLSDVVSGKAVESIVFSDCSFDVSECTHFMYIPPNGVDKVKLLEFKDCSAKITHAVTSNYAASGLLNYMPIKTVISGSRFELAAKIYQLFTAKPSATNALSIIDSEIVNSNSYRTNYFFSGNGAYDVWIENSTLSNYVNMLYGGGDTTTGEIVLLNDRFVDFPRPDGKSDADNVTITNITRDNTKYLSGAKSNIQAQLDAKSNFSGSYNDLTDKPTIPSKTSELTNDSGFLTSHQSLANYYNKTEVNSLLGGKADSSSVYTRSQLSEKNLVITDGSQTTTYKILVVI